MQIEKGLQSMDLAMSAGKLGHNTRMVKLRETTVKCFREEKICYHYS